MGLSLKLKLPSSRQLTVSVEGEEHFPLSGEESALSSARSLPLSARQDDSWTSAISNNDSHMLVKLLLQEVEKVPYSKKKELGWRSKDSHQLATEFIHSMQELLSHNFFAVDLVHSSSRDVMDSDWSSVTACKRSEAGTTGIYFIQCESSAVSQPSSRSKQQAKTSVIVGKPLSVDDFERHVFVNAMTKDFFKIRCPKIRLLDRKAPPEAMTDGRNLNEYFVLEASIRKLFSPLHEELYINGGKASPKGLFSSSSVVLMELVKGQPLCHRINGQRELVLADYRAIGRLFYLDLLIRNTDRLPCRKAIPRPGNLPIGDQGNAGNLMFGKEPGSLWAIDPEMQTSISAAMMEEYGVAFDSVVEEIVNSQANHSHFKVISGLFFEEVPMMEGILDCSLDQLSDWAGRSPLEKQGIDIILNCIRLRVAADVEFLVDHTAFKLPPPTTSIEKEWRNWIRLSIPRAVVDILDFIAYHTG